MFLRQVYNAGVLGVLTAIAACSTLQPAPQPYPLPQPSQTAAPAPVDDAAIGWNTILSVTSAPAGWLVYPCQNPALLCIQENGELAGTVELIALPVEGSQFRQMLIDAGISPEAIAAEDSRIQSVLQAWVSLHYDGIKQDRDAAGSGLRFSAQSPELVPVGDLEGIRYKFTTLQPDGELFERTVGYAATDGEVLYVIVAALMNGDPSGTFMTDAGLAEFEPHLERIVAGLNLPASN